MTEDGQPLAGRDEERRRLEASRWIEGRWSGAFTDSDEFLVPPPLVGAGDVASAPIVIIRFPSPDSIARTIRKHFSRSDPAQPLFLVGLPPLGWPSIPHMIKTIAAMSGEVGILDGIDGDDWFALKLDKSGSRTGLSMILHDMAGRVEDLLAQANPGYKAVLGPDATRSDSLLSHYRHEIDRLVSLLVQRDREYELAVERVSNEVDDLNDELDHAATVVSDLVYQLETERWKRTAMRRRRWWRLGSALRSFGSRPIRPIQSLKSLRSSMVKAPNQDPPTRREAAAVNPLVRRSASSLQSTEDLGARSKRELSPEELEVVKDDLASSESGEDFMRRLRQVTDRRDAKTTRRVLRRASRVASARGWLEERLTVAAQLSRDPYDDSDRLEYIEAQLAVQNLHEAAHLIAGLTDIDELSDRGRHVVEDVQTYSRLVDELAWADELRKPRFEPIEGKVVAFLHNSLPYSNGGYATRAHGLLTAVAANGFDVVAYTRPGYPLDHMVATDIHLPSEDSIDGLTYRRLFEDFDRRLPESRYILKTAAAYERVLRREMPQIVHGRSTYLSALPALIAARRCGLPFAYEVSGLWEVVHASRETASKRAEQIRRITFLETLVATGSDHVFTLNHAMEDELVGRGVNRDSISIVPNSVDPVTFVPVERNEALAQELGLSPGVPVIGYIGSFQDYEGLDDLISACEVLLSRGVDFRAMLVGSGAIRDRLAEAIRDKGIADTVLLLDRVSYTQVPEYYSLVDIAPFPRKPIPVTEMVTPMKPLEAMALGKCVIVSNVRPLTELVNHRQTGLTFDTGDPKELANELQRAIEDRDLRGRLGSSARRWVLDARTWERAAGEVIAGYARVMKSKTGHG